MGAGSGDSAGVYSSEISQSRGGLGSSTSDLAPTGGSFVKASPPCYGINMKSSRNKERDEKEGISKNEDMFGL
uniref:Uncharacterized protein n=1 Tax=Pristionchus pacificus TaxID=54126 RepID=A0A2A6BCR2_PRIPA|eukprot:PDM63673.1 hypothetical protein PRIPAC_49646 [Pristionchus pacificus]